jgi:hypothetical protein
VPSMSPSGTGEKMPPKERAIVFPAPSDPGMVPGPALVYTAGPITKLCARGGRNIVEDICGRIDTIRPRLIDRG